MEGFAVTLESLYTKKIKEISYSEEESYQEKPTLSQRLTELAQRVDFSDRTGDEDSEPAAKKTPQRWPWEVANSKLRQALTEISVLSDVIQIAQHQQKYVALDPVVTTPSGSASPAYQYFVKKKSLGMAAEILHRGTKSLSQASTEKEREFHKALSSLRQRWRLKRIGSGAIIGDLSYHSAGSTYSGTVSFDVSKYSSGASADSAATISVTIPREFRGKSEVLVFLSPEPVQEIPQLSAFPPPLSVSQVAGLRKDPLSVDLNLIAAQNMLFNQELFTHLAHEAYDEKPQLQHEVFTNRINVPLSMDCWLSIIHVREYEDHHPKPPQGGPPSSFPPVRWDLVVALKQLLRETHKKLATLVKPRPSTAGFLERPEVRNAGVTPLKSQDIMNLDTKISTFSKFMDKARHVYNTQQLQQWLSDLCSSSADPTLRVLWQPDPSFTLTVANVIVTDSLASPESHRCCVRLVLKVGQMTVTRAKECGGEITFQLQQEKLLRILKHEITFQRMKHARKLAEDHGWQVGQELPHPLQSSTLAKLQDSYSSMTSLLLESGDRQRKMELLFGWGDLTARVGRLARETAAGRDAVMGGVEKWEAKQVSLQDMVGSNFREKITSLVTDHHH